MSLQAMQWVLYESPNDLDPNEFRILAIFADHANPQGENIFLSRKTIAQLAHVSERTVSTKTGSLLRRGLIQPGDVNMVDHLPAGKRPNVWNIVMDKNWRILPTCDMERDLVDDGVQSLHPTAGAGEGSASGNGAESGVKNLHPTGEGDVQSDVQSGVKSGVKHGCTQKERKDRKDIPPVVPQTETHADTALQAPTGPRPDVTAGEPEPQAEPQTDTRPESGSTLAAGAGGARTVLEHLAERRGEYGLETSTGGRDLKACERLLGELASAGDADPVATVVGVVDRLLGRSFWQRSLTSGRALERRWSEMVNDVRVDGRPVRRKSHRHSGGCEHVRVLLGVDTPGDALTHPLGALIRTNLAAGYSPEDAVADARRQAAKMAGRRVES